VRGSFPTSQANLQKIAENHRYDIMKAAGNLSSETPPNTTDTTGGHTNNIPCRFNSKEAENVFSSLAEGENEEEMTDRQKKNRQELKAKITNK